MNDQNASPRRPAARTLLVGNGKLARHLSHYLELKSAPYFHWKNARSIAHIPEPELAQATVIWILVSDQAISEVQLNIKKLAPHAVYFHSSAALSVPGVFTLHPLQTFGPRLYELSTYQNITFTAIKEEWTEVPQAGLELMKALANPLQTLANSDRTLYHAACTMTANFPIILWTEVFRMMDKKTGISSEAFLPLLR
ncbi:MAG: DUF2520 domain-containing protein, partial [Bdellovibrionales bacterium]|nr:DUF2520 domain-containing protein [Oligoflexia bacterium]